MRNEKEPIAEASQMDCRNPTAATLHVSQKSADIAVIQEHRSEVSVPTKQDDHASLLLAALHTQRSNLDPSSQTVFDRAWGLDESGDWHALGADPPAALIGHVPRWFKVAYFMVKCGKKVVYLLLCCLQRLQLWPMAPTQTGQLFAARCMRMKQTVTKIFSFFNIWPDIVCASVIDFTILQTFFVDLCGPDTLAESVLQLLLRRTTKLYRPVTWAWRRWCMIFSLAMHMILLAYMFIFCSRGGLWQYSLSGAIMLQWFCEIFVLETVDALWLKTCIPAIGDLGGGILSHAKRTYLAAAVAADTAVDGVTDDLAPTRDSFNACQYLFVSTNLCKQFSSSLAARIVSRHYQDTPGPAGRRWSMIRPATPPPWHPPRNILVLLRRLLRKMKTRKFRIYLEQRFRHFIYEMLRLIVRCPWALQRVIARCAFTAIVLLLGSVVYAIQFYGGIHAIWQLLAIAAGIFISVYYPRASVCWNRCYAACLTWLHSHHLLGFGDFIRVERKRIAALGNHGQDGLEWKQLPSYAAIPDNVQMTPDDEPQSPTRRVVRKRGSVSPVTPASIPPVAIESETPSNEVAASAEAIVELDSKEKVQPANPATPLISRDPYGVNERSWEPEEVVPEHTILPEKPWKVHKQQMLILQPMILEAPSGVVDSAQGVNVLSPVSGTTAPEGHFSVAVSHEDDSKSKPQALKRLITKMKSTRPPT